MSQQITYQVKLQGSDGKEYIQPINAFIKEHANIDGVRNYFLTQIKERINELDFMIGLLKPQLLAALRLMFLDYLQQYHGKNSFHKFEACVGFLNSREVPTNFNKLAWDLFEAFLTEGLIQRKGNTGWFSFVPKDNSKEAKKVE